MGTSKFESLTAATEPSFPEYEDPDGEPVALLRRWLADAQVLGVREPLALALATADERGRASTRIVAITSITDTGLVFLSHECSQKGRELAATGWASGVLYWRETGQQVIVSGPVRKLGGAESDALWRARPVPLHAMSAASRQSEPLPDVGALREHARRLAASGVALPRPARFHGYLLEPAAVEFWCASQDRLHRRLRYDRETDGWRLTRLQP
ncbi:MAG TPA: phenazine biosynthesis FMN-dependent oxidase PhzG [Streptosporangiaceae bacterium]|nr:phenazine biosynthesis FMN-dependent oxidase PhzG [Streptosporangiaceae bacterium]